MELDALVERTVTHDDDAWRQLLERITPSIQTIARSHESMRSRGLSDRADDLADVALAVISRLAQNDFKNLHRYLTQRELDKPQSFDSWLYGAVDFAIREHLRSRFGRAPQPKEVATRVVPSKRELNTQAEMFDEDLLRVSISKSLGMTDKLEVGRIVRYVEANFSREEVQALQLYYAADRGVAEIAALLQLPDEQAASKLLRRLIARLRHRFGGTDE